MIGILTAIVGDIATIFGCLIGLRKDVTAITFVALGTSLPDLFASRSAAVNEKYADASVGNVTGSNGVNVFLGLGIPWLIASIYHEVKVNLYVENVLPKPIKTHTLLKESFLVKFGSIVNTLFFLNIF